MNPDKLKKARKALGLTQEELAEKSGVSRGHISQIEAGNTKTTNPASIVKLAKALKVEVEDLMDYEDPVVARAAKKWSKKLSPEQVTITK